MAVGSEGLVIHQDLQRKAKNAMVVPVRINQCPSQILAGQSLLMSRFDPFISCLTITINLLSRLLSPASNALVRKAFVEVATSQGFNNAPESRWSKKTTDSARRGNGEQG
jgi:hypothetical protein